MPQISAKSAKGSLHEVGAGRTFKCSTGSCPVIMDAQITDAKLDKYFSVTGEALALAKKHIVEARRRDAADAIDMVERYVADAQHFRERGDIVNAFAALNYAHGWLDCGARTGVFDVKDSRLFTVDDE